jgi:hypothetical protein
MCNPEALAQMEAASVPSPRNVMGAAATVNAELFGAQR